MTWRALREKQIGNHLYAQCARCGKWLKLTGFWKGVHLCDYPDEEEEDR